MTEITQKRIKRRKIRESFDKRIRNVKTGRKPLEEKELNDEQKQLAEMLGRGIDKESIKGFLNLSDYKIERYLQLPKLKEKKKRWEKVFSKKDVEKWSSLYDEVITEAFSTLRKRIREDKITENNLISFIRTKLAAIGLLASQQEDTTRLTEKRTRTFEAPKQLTQDNNTTRQEHIL